MKAFSIDFNWGEGGVNGFAAPGLWADASPKEHIEWYEGLGVNVVQTFAVSCNGYAWYKNGVVPPQPGLKYDFLPEMVKLGHKKNIKVMGYFCVGANTLWAEKHPEMSYGSPNAYHIPFTDEYLDYLCGSIADALKKTGMDGFMIDWVWNPAEIVRGKKWLACEKKLFEKLMSKPFPGEDKLSEKEEIEYGRRAIDRCWGRIHQAAKQAKPDCVIWLTCNELMHPTVVNSRMFREADWLMNEATDPRTLDDVKKMIGPHTRLIQCLVGWGDKHNAKKALSNTAYRNYNIYGFTKPNPDSLPLPIDEYLSKPVDKFKGNDRNIAVLARFFNGLSLDY